MEDKKDTQGFDWSDETQVQRENARRKQNRMILIIVLGVLFLAMVGVLIYSIIQTTVAEEQRAADKLLIEQLQLDKEQLTLAAEFREIDDQFKRYEGQEGMIANDSILDKYAAAKNRIEQLLQELKNEKTKNAQRVKELEAEIASLKELLRHYLAQIDELQKENAGLQEENAGLIAENSQLSSQIEIVSQQNEQRADSMRLAKKLNISNLTFTPLKKNGKKEKKIKNAKQLDICFTVPQNHSTPVGEKVIYLRVTTPEGTLLGNAGTFDFEGVPVPYTAKKVIEYAGEEMTNVHIYWNVTSTLSKGEYTVELFADNYRLISRKFTITK